MNRFYQNFIYLGILISIIGLFFTIKPSFKNVPHGIYLSTDKKHFKPLDVEKLNFLLASRDTFFNNYNLLKNNSIGVVSSYMYCDKIDDFDKSCSRNIEHAKYIAAKYGAKKLIGYCAMGSLDTSKIYALAYQ